MLFYSILFSAIYLLCGAVTCIADHGSYKALHRTNKRSDKPGALLTFRSRFAMIPR